MIAIAHNRHIVWDRHDGLITLMDELCVAVSGILGAHIATELDLIRVFRSAQLERVAVL